MMFKPGDKVMLKYDDDSRNSSIVGKTTKVVAIMTAGAPYWITVSDGKHNFNVRGADCQPMK